MVKPSQAFMATSLVMLAGGQNVVRDLFLFALFWRLPHGQNCFRNECY